MYDNSRVPLYTNISSRPCRVQYSRWSLNAPSTGRILCQTLPQSTATVSSSFYLPQTQRHKQKITPNYVNLQPLPAASSSSLSSGYERPKSTIFPSYSSVDPSPFYVNNPPQRYDSKTVVGIVKPMVHQRSYIQLNHNNNNNNDHNNYIENKFPELMIDSYQHKSTRSLYPPPTPPTPPLPPPPPPLSSSSSSASSSVIYRSRPTPSYNSINGQAPQIPPRRHSSINNAKYLSSHRSSRSTSTSSSTAALNELSSTISSYENESRQQQLEVKEKSVNRPPIDVKRLEMFYGSVGTLVKSARSVVHLYTTTTRQLANFEDWSCQQFGVPIWIYNTVRIIHSIMSHSLIYFDISGSKFKTCSTRSIVTCSS